MHVDGLHYQLGYRIINKRMEMINNEKTIIDGTGSGYAVLCTE